jgi:uroporphyrinogen decarboxylase
MTSRERVEKLLNGEPVDRIPNGLGGCETTGMHNVLYHKLKKVLGVDDPKNRVCTFMNNAIFEPAVLDAIGGDVILLGSQMCPSRFWGPQAEREWKPVKIWDIDLQVADNWDFRQDPDGTWWWGKGTAEWSIENLTTCPAGGYYFDPPGGFSSAPAEDPLPSDYNPPHEIPEERLKRLEEDAKWLYDNTEYAIACGENILDLQARHGGIESWWMRMAAEPEVCHEFLEKNVDATLAQLKQLDQAVGKYCVSLLIADDIGDTRGVTIGPEMWRQIYKPHYARLFSEWHKITTMKVSLHCCGSIPEILEDLIECGVDMYNPVQISANGMDPARLKELAGGRLVFYGGVYDAVLYKPEMPEEDVYEAVKRNIEIFSAGGGYMFAGVHNLPPEMPEGHIRAFLRAYHDLVSFCDAGECG